METLKGLINRGIAEEGYIEKASNKDLDSKTANKGSNNYTKYSRDIDAYGLMGCQGQPWCCTFQFWLEVQEFGLEKALKHWNMTRKTYVGYNCFSTYNTFKKAGKVGMTPQVGAVVIFNFSHAGRVIRIYSENGRKYWDCLEANTSSSLSDRNGGQVKIKKRPWNDSTVKGFCYIDYQEDVVPGWKNDQYGWWYLKSDGTYPVSKWELINGHKYLFNKNGYMRTGWHRWNPTTKQVDPEDGSGDYYYLEESGKYEGACWHEKPGGNGALERWKVTK